MNSKLFSGLSGPGGIMALRNIFICRECGAKQGKWFGRCPACGAWDALDEEIGDSKAKPVVTKTNPPRPITEIELKGGQHLPLGLCELDAVLGGGLTPGSSLLLGGEPGIGKSTLLLQAARLVAQKYGAVLYISGEESARQIRLSAERLGALDPKMLLLAETNIESALANAENQSFKLVIVDSVQAVYSSRLESAPGSVSQVRAVAAACLEYSRKSGAALILVGHVTKEGLLAGPRVLEHMVDTVLYFEGDRYTSLRLLRAVKNRFGSTNELGIFEMSGNGLLPFTDPSGFFLSQRPLAVPGSVVTCVMQGTRSLLLEVQALVAPTSFGNPRRLASGIDYNRLLLIVAVLERKLGLPLGAQDIYLNIAGGLRAEDPALDLAAAAAIASSFYEKPVEEGVVACGEVGLLGEVRAIGQNQRRRREAANFGFKQILLPEINRPKKGEEEESAAPGQIKPVYVADLEQALKLLGLIAQ